MNGEVTALHIKVKPGSFKDKLFFDQEGNLVAKIREKPIEGAANDYLVKYIAKELGLPKSSIQLEKGSASRFKKLLISLSSTELEIRLQRYKK